jgi:hypothetical protein
MKPTHNFTMFILVIGIDSLYDHCHKSPEKIKPEYEKK